MKNVNPNPPLLAAAPAGASQTSAKLDSQQICYISVQAITTGGTSLVGSVQLQASNDPTIAQNIAKDFTPTNWSNIGSPVAVSGNGAFMIPAQLCSYRWMQVVYTYTSGTGGTITINVDAISF